MHRRLFLGKSLATAAVVVSGCTADRNADHSRELKQMLGGKKGLELLRSFDTVEAFRLQNSEYHQTLAKYKTVAGPIVVGQATAAKLAGLLSSSTSYLWNVVTGCLPEYGIRIRYSAGNSSLDILFCFYCDNVVFYLNGKAKGGGLFDPMQPQLVPIMKSLFPDDDSIQSLKEHKRVPPPLP